MKGLTDDDDEKNTDIHNEPSWSGRHQIKQPGSIQKNGAFVTASFTGAYGRASILWSTNMTQAFWFIGWLANLLYLFIFLDIYSNDDDNGYLWVGL